MAKKKIGFIDEYLDNWHAENYPGLIAKSELGGEFEVALAWEMRPAPTTGATIDQWCKKHGVGKAKSIEQVVAECDCIAVLAPRDARTHEQLADVALRSGKPVYIDKPFAPDVATARRLFEKAERHGTPMYSSSALRFGSALTSALAGPLADKKVSYVATRGSGQFAEYAIHQIEMLVMTLGTGARRVMQVGNTTAQQMLVDYGDGRRGEIALVPNHEFTLVAGWGVPGNGGSHRIDQMSDFFPRFIDAMLRFFQTARASAPKEQTIEIAALLQAGCAGLERMDQWVDVPR